MSGGCFKEFKTVGGIFYMRAKFEEETEGENVKTIYTDIERERESGGYKRG